MLVAHGEKSRERIFRFGLTFGEQIRQVFSAEAEGYQNFKEGGIVSGLWQGSFWDTVTIVLDA
jgi:hypothetical protein